RLWAVMAAMAVAGILSMAYYYNHYGQLLHGWDAQFYYATARSFLFGRTADITDALKETPWTSPFDRDGNGSLERVPLREDGRFQSKYPIGLPLVEGVFMAVGYGIRRILETLGIFLTGPPGLSHLEIGSVALGLFLVTLVGLRKLAS